MNFLSKTKSTVELVVIGGTVLFAIHGLAVFAKESAEMIGEAIDNRAERLEKKNSDIPA